MIVLPAALALALPLAMQEPPLPGPEVLRNGMRVQLLPYPEARDAILLLAVGTGERDDPPEWPGMAHCLEHLVLTSGAGGEPGRSFAELNRDYRMVNGQTLWDHAVFYWILDPDALEAELEKLATRITRLEITEADLAREIPRLELELHNMYSLWPQLAPVNLLLTCLRGGPDGPRRGGEIEKLRRLRPEDLQARWNAVTRPGNLFLAVAGRFEEDAVRAAILDRFGALACAEDAPKPAARLSPPKSGRFTLQDPNAPGPTTLLGFRPRGPSPEGLADFAAVAYSLALQPAGGFRAQYLLLEDPFVLLILPHEPGAPDGESRVREWLQRARQQPVHPWIAEGVRTGLQAFQARVPDAQLAMLPHDPNPLYAAAYAAAMRTLRGDAAFWAAFDRRVAALTPESLAAARKAVLDEERAVFLNLQPRPPQD